MHMTIMRGAQLLCIIILNKTNDVQKYKNFSIDKQKDLHIRMYEHLQDFIIGNF